METAQVEREENYKVMMQEQLDLLGRWLKDTGHGAHGLREAGGE